MDFKGILIEWFSINKRDLPWRNTADPYLIWVAEVILQQTRVAQGIGYYQMFIGEFPTIYDLAQASEDSVLKVWQGLGYYTRARNLHSSAQHIVSQRQGVIPSTYRELLTIKGLGHYSAGAIASFAFGEPVPAMDGNVYRVIARVFGLFASPYTAAGRSEFHSLLMELMDKQNPHTFNQALLDFGALQCLPKGPKCVECPLAGYCYALRNNLIHALPIKSKRIVPRNRYFTYIIIRYNQGTFISKRQGQDIWHSLYEFPLIESPEPLSLGEVQRHTRWKELLGREKVEVLHFSQPVKHQLSHQTLHAQFLIVRIRKPTALLLGEYLFIPATSVSQYSVPRLIDSFLAAEPAEQYMRNTPT